MANSTSERYAMADLLISRAKNAGKTEVVERLEFLKKTLENFGLDDSSSVAAICIDREKKRITDTVLVFVETFLIETTSLLEHAQACTLGQCALCDVYKVVNEQAYGIFKDTLKLFVEEVPTRGLGEGPSGANA